MEAYFPITYSIGKDADFFIKALHLRQEQIKKTVDSQNLLKKVAFAALKIFGLAFGVVTIACLPVTTLMFAAIPIMIQTFSFAASIASLALYMFLNPRNPGELIIKDLWKSVFEALRKGEGKQILKTCQELAKQKEKRLASFNQCLGVYSTQDPTPFFHKICLIGYLQTALEHLRNYEEEQAKSYGHVALSYFDASGFSKEVENFIARMIESPPSIRSLIERNHLGKDLHALDHLITLVRDN